ncbi:molybdopterin molybdenumtransferase MoeA [bacterium]|nr:molybdopterin molybdenumtransferase MoeA [bacterium]
MSARSMISFADAETIVLSHAKIQGKETIPIEQSINRILAADVVSDIPMPPFPKSIRDGYACRREDLNGELKLVETVHAGQIPQKRLNKNECAKIMTGAMVPEGADCVVMVEQTETVATNTIRWTAQNTDDNIAKAGEDIQIGDRVLSKGERITPPQLAVLSAVGCTHPVVFQQPKVGILETGDELVPPEQKPGPSQIRAGIRYPLQAQIEAVNGIVDYYGIAKDNESSLENALKYAGNANQVVLVAGGVSMGDLDLVPGIVARNGFDILFDAVAVQPGKPTTFAVNGEIVIIGLPGNPVSSMVQFELLVKPFLYAMQGFSYSPPVTRLPLVEAIERKATDRESWLPARITDNGYIQPLEYHGSAHVNALCHSHGLISLPVGVTRREKNAYVNIRLW